MIFVAHQVALHRAWISEGILPPVPEGTVVRINTADLPERCAAQLAAPIKERLESSVLKKANRQIRSTKERLNAEDARGLLLVVNDGNFLLAPDLFRYVLAKATYRQYSSIDAVIYATVNAPMDSPEINMDVLLWIPMELPEREPIRPRFIRKLTHGWFDHYARVTGQRVSAFSVRDEKREEVLDGMRFIAKSYSGRRR